MSQYSAFYAICKEAESPKGVYLSLYASVPYYGGPEEGGWWGSDTVLEASQSFAFEEEASAAKEKVDKLAQEMSETARRSYGQQCLDEIEWCEARGLDHETFLREPDGPTRYFTVLEVRRGSMEHQGDRHYS